MGGDLIGLYVADGVLTCLDVAGGGLTGGYG